MTTTEILDCFTGNFTAFQSSLEHEAPMADVSPTVTKLNLGKLMLWDPVVAAAYAVRHFSNTMLPPQRCSVDTTTLPFSCGGSSAAESWDWATSHTATATQACGSTKGPPHTCWQLPLPLAQACSVTTPASTVGLQHKLTRAAVVQLRSIGGQPWHWNGQEHAQRR